MLQYNQSLKTFLLKKNQLKYMSWPELFLFFKNYRNVIFLAGLPSIEMVASLSHVPFPKSIKAK